MAEVILNTNLSETVWLRDYLTSYVRASGFDRYMGRSDTAIFRTFTETTTDGGKDIIVPLVGNLRGNGVSGSQVLEGNEEDMEQFADRITTNWRRNAVKVPMSTSYKTNLDLLNITRPRLRDWAAQVVMKKGIIQNLQGIVVQGAANAEGFLSPDIVLPYATANATQRNAFVVNNADRILFGADIANASSGVMATALATIDNTNDKLTPALISKAKRIAQATSSLAGTNTGITPYMTDDGEEWFVMFVHPRAMRDLRNDATMTQANRDAMERGKTNPLFRGGDLLWDGVIIREIFDMELITGAGASGIDVAHNFLAGQGSIGIAWGQEPRIIADDRQDYRFRPAVAIQELIGIKKLSFQGVQYGGVSVFTAAAADA